MCDILVSCSFYCIVPVSVSRARVSRQQDVWCLWYISMPRDESTGMTKGRAFITYSTPEAAQLARAGMNGYELTISHQLSIVIA